MPNREYICDACNHTYDTYQPLHEELHKKCPECGKNKLYQNLQGIIGRVKNINTIGQLAEQNTKKLGKYGLEAREKHEKDNKENLQRERAAIASKRTGKKIVAKCDLPKGNVKPMDKDISKKIFSGDAKDQNRKIEKYINTGEV